MACGSLLLLLASATKVLGGSGGTFGSAAPGAAAADAVAPARLKRVGLLGLLAHAITHLLALMKYHQRQISASGIWSTPTRACSCDKLRTDGHWWDAASSAEKRCEEAQQIAAVSDLALDSFSPK